MTKSNVWIFSFRLVHQDFSHGIRAKVLLSIFVYIKKLKINNSSFLSQSFLQNTAASIHSSNQQIGVTPIASTTTNVLHQVLNHSLPIKLDTTNYILKRTQMENIVFANGFEDHAEGLKPCPPKETSFGDINLEFIHWRRYDRMILRWLYSSLTQEIMG